MRASPVEIADPAMAHLARLAEQERRRRRLIRGSAGAAAAAHIVLFTLRFPAAAQDKPEQKPPVAVVRLDNKVLARPTPPPKPPDPPVKNEPVPAADPDAPEPFRDPEPEAAVVDFDPAAFVAENVAPPPPPPEPTPELILVRVTQPERTFSVDPVYPEIARQAKMQGIVVLEIVIGPDGGVSDIKVLRGGALGLTEAAVDAVRRWRYRPTMVGSRRVAAVATVTVTFRLQG